MQALNARACFNKEHVFMNEYEWVMCHACQNLDVCWSRYSFWEYYIIWGLIKTHTVHWHSWHMTHVFVQIHSYVSRMSMRTQVLMTILFLREYWVWSTHTMHWHSLHMTHFYVRIHSFVSRRSIPRCMFIIIAHIPPKEPYNHVLPKEPYILYTNLFQQFSNPGLFW